MTAVLTQALRFADLDSPTVVFDSDLGHDLDDTIALAVLAKTVRNLVVVTNDEPLARPRAQFARALLDAMGRPEVIVVAGHQLHGSEDRFLMDGVVPHSTPSFTDVAAVLAQVCETSTGPVIWIGAGPATNLSTLFVTSPHLIEKIQVTMQGGWLDHYRRPDRASHNPRMDPAAFGLMLRAAHQPRLVFSTHTNIGTLAVTTSSPLYAALTAPDAPPWTRLPAVHAQRWLAHRPSSWMNDPATVAAALGLPVVDFATETVRIAPDARLHRDPHGRQIQVSTSLDGPAVMNWISTTLALPDPQSGSADHPITSGR
ncbi:nucleoside hydrolase [Nocardia noduli]|uniref:nucleoside hydrolase n=1 Tax=Nocardia noduli TaxID=2815722 RepID=UPI001C241FEA|nr:nucleoside hydrolase [Nocardia noduli]